MLQKVFSTKIVGTSAAEKAISGMHRLDSKSSMASSSSTSKSIEIDDGERITRKVSESSSNTSGEPESSSSSSSSIEHIDKKGAGTNNGRDYSKLLKYVSLLVLILQNAALVLVTRYATTRHQTPFLKTVAVFYNEIVKIIVAFVLFFATAGLSKKGLRDFRDKFNLMDTLKLGIPAVAYTLQTSLLYVAIENLDAATFMVTYQLKILMTALFTIIILKRRLSVLQWMALLLLIAGVATVQFSADEQQKSAQLASGSKGLLSVNALNSTTSVAAHQMFNNLTKNNNNTDPIHNMLFASRLLNNNTIQVAAELNSSTISTTLHYHHQNLVIGLLAVLAVCTLSGFAGVYIEKILKKDKTISIWMQNIELGLMAIPFSLLVIAAYDGRKVLSGGFMQGFDLYVWVIILLQSLGGIATAVVIKYADNILKSFAVAFGIMLVTIASIFLFSIYPKPLFMLGAILVIAAVATYSLFPYKKRTIKSDVERKLAIPGKGVRFSSAEGQMQKS